MVTSQPAHLSPATVASLWLPIDRLRQSADAQLAVIAAAVGVDSRLHRHCREVWGSWEREALVSILNRDFANAEVILDRGVHALVHALELVRENRLSEDDLVSLIAGA
jgi:hypothetical protein